MPHRFADGVLETTTTTGTGALALAGALTGFIRFNAIPSIAVNDTVWYAVWGVDGSGNRSGEWEIGLGTYSAANTLTRTTVRRSSNGGAAVNFSAGTKWVTVAAISDRVAQLDDELAIPIPARTSPATAAPAGHGKIYARERAGRVVPEWVGPAGIDTALQPAMFGNNIVLWTATTGTTVASAFGSSWTARNAGTGAAQSHPARAVTNLLTQMNRAQFGTGTTATGSSGIQSALPAAWRGNAAGFGGFFAFWRFGITTAEAAMQLLLGLSALNAALAGEPSAQNHTVAIGADSTDANLQIITRDGTTASKINTGISKTATGVVYDFTLWAPPNASSIRCRLVNVNTGVAIIENQELTANLPGNTQFLFAHAQLRSTVGTTAKVFDLNRIYVESDT